MSDRGLTPRALRDIKSAAHAGRFRFADPELALTLAAGVLRGLAQLLHDEPKRDAAEASDRLPETYCVSTEYPPTRRKKICRRSLPDVDVLTRSALAKETAPIEISQ
jgi:hypothetical protein